MTDGFIYNFFIIILIKKSIHEVYQKSSRMVSKKIYFKPKVHIKSSTIQSNPPSSLMFFPIFCHTCMHSWKVSFRIFFNFIITGFLMSSSSLKWVPLMNFLSFGNRKNYTEPGQVNRKITPAQ